jgi:hypothetical protein
MKRVLVSLSVDTPEQTGKGWKYCFFRRNRRATLFSDANASYPTMEEAKQAGREYAKKYGWTITGEVKTVEFINS